MNVTVEMAPVEDKPVLRNMLQLYIYDFSEFAGFELDEHGFYAYRYLDFYWVEEGRFPFLVRVDGNLAGFVFVRTEWLETGPRYGIAEFFIMRKYRRHGIGERVAREVFGRFPGHWAFHVDLRNEAGIPFWRTVAGRIAAGQVTELPGEGPHRIVLEFDTTG